LEIFSEFEIKKIFEAENTLYIIVNGVKISFITYDYKNIGSCIEHQYFTLASIEDIGAMKLSAIQDRATNKDYVDLYVVIREIGLKNLLDAFFQKFGNIISDSYLLKALIYFDDIKEEPLLINDPMLTFDKVKD
jgi:predicted nucleotidyltransferase component of viral defense system